MLDLIKGAAAGADTHLEELDPAAIRTDGGTQMRAAINRETVEEYAQAMLAGDRFPPIVVYYDGETHWLGDGFHRLAAWRQVMDDTIAAEVRAGTRRDAILLAAGANADHGLRRTNSDKRRAALTLLQDDEWRDWSDREIARRCKVSNRFVTNLRAELQQAGQAPAPTVRKYTRNGEERTMETEKIGSTKATQAHEEPEIDWLKGSIPVKPASKYLQPTVNGLQWEPTETPETPATPDPAPASTPPPIAPPAPAQPAEGIELHDLSGPVTMGQPANGIAITVSRHTLLAVYELVASQPGRENLTAEVRAEFEVRAEEALGMTGAPPPLNPGAMNDDLPDWRDLWDDAAEINQIEMGAYWTVDDITSPALCLRLLEEDDGDLAPALRRRYLALTK